jgi:hypothetical protein
LFEFRTKTIFSMMNPRHLILLLALISHANGSEDIRQKTLEGQPQVELDRVIDPDKSIFGFALGTSEDDFIAKCGKPVGYLRLKHDKSALLYGNSMAFLFKGGKLSGVWLGDGGVLNYPFYNELKVVDILDDRGWKLSNGIKNNMDLVTVRKILGDALVAEHPDSLYQQFYNTDNSRVALSFSRSGRDNEKDENAYFLSSVYITPKVEEQE